MNHHPSKADAAESHNDNYRFNINLLCPASPPDRNTGRSIPSQFPRTRNANLQFLLAALTEAIEIADPLIAFIRAETGTSAQVLQLRSSSSPTLLDSNDEDRGTTSITTTDTSAPRPRGRFIAPGMDPKRRCTNETLPEKDP